MAHPIVGVAASADNLDALFEFLAALDRSDNWSMVIAVHAAELLRGDIAECMQDVCDVPVFRVVERAFLRPGAIYLLPNDRQLTFENSHVFVSPVAYAQHAFQSLIDRLLHILAKQPPPHSIGVVLGPVAANSAGMSALQQSGGLAFVYDRKARIGADRPAEYPDLYYAASPSAIAFELGELCRVPYTHEVGRREPRTPWQRLQQHLPLNEQNRVLVVGPKAVPEGSMEALLESWGHQVLTASNAVDALELAATMRPPVAFIDVMHADFPGHDICFRMRRQHAGGDTLLVGMVNTAHANEQHAALSAGFHAIFSARDDELSLRWLAAAQRGPTTPAGWLFP